MNHEQIIQDLDDLDLKLVVRSRHLLYKQSKRIGSHFLYPELALAPIKLDLGEVSLQHPACNTDLSKQDLGHAVRVLRCSAQQG